MMYIILFIDLLFFIIYTSPACWSTCFLFHNQKSNVHFCVAPSPRHSQFKQLKRPRKKCGHIHMTTHIQCVTA